MGKREWGNLPPPSDVLYGKDEGAKMDFGTSHPCTFWIEGPGTLSTFFNLKQGFKTPPSFWYSGKVPGVPSEWTETEWTKTERHSPFSKEFQAPPPPCSPYKAGEEAEARARQVLQREEGGPPPDSPALLNEPTKKDCFPSAHGGPGFCDGQGPKSG